MCQHLTVPLSTESVDKAVHNNPHLRLTPRKQGASWRWLAGDRQSEIARERRLQHCAGERDIRGQSAQVRWIADDALSRGDFRLPHPGPSVDAATSASSVRDAFCSEKSPPG